MQKKKKSTKNTHTHTHTHKIIIIKYKNFLHWVARSWTSKVQNPVLINCNCQRSNQHQGGLNGTPQADTPGISAHINWAKLLLVGNAKRSILPESVKCMLHIRSKVKLDTFVNSTLFCLTEGLVWRYTT